MFWYVAHGWALGTASDKNYITIIIIIMIIAVLIVSNVGLHLYMKAAYSH